MTLYLPIADGQVNAYDAYKYNPMRKFKGIGFIIMIQEPGTMPMTDGGKFYRKSQFQQNPFQNAVIWILRKTLTIPDANKFYRTITFTLCRSKKIFSLRNIVLV